MRISDEAFRGKRNIKPTEAYVTLNPRVAHHFWIPDIFLDRAKDIRVPTYFTKPASLRIYNDSTLRYSSRINFDVACTMDFHRFPVDEQLCEIDFESFGHTSNQLKFAWKRNSSNINPNITLAQFLMDVKLEDTYATDYYDLSYPGIIMKITLTREIGYHVVQTYIPSIVFVILAWLSLFISPESVPGEIALKTLFDRISLALAFVNAKRNTRVTQKHVRKLSTLSHTFLFLCQKKVQSRHAGERLTLDPKFAFFILSSFSLTFQVAWGWV